MPFSPRSDWVDLPQTSTPVFAADLLRYEIGIANLDCTFLPCRVATTTAITLSGLQTVDGVSLNAGDRVLNKDDSTALNRGIYVVGSGAWSRAADMPSGATIKVGATVQISSGTQSAGVAYEVTVVLSSSLTATVGTSSLTFTPCGRKILSAGTAMTSRPQLNFIGTGLTVADNSGTNSTDITIAAGSSGGSGFTVRVATTQQDSSTSGLQTVDGVSLANGDRVFYRTSSSATFNGIYTVNSAGSWPRATDMPSGASVQNGSLLYVHEGAVYGGRTFLLNNVTAGSTAAIVGTNPLDINLLGPSNNWVTPPFDTSTPSEPVAQIFVPGNYKFTLTANTIIGIVDGVADTFSVINLCIIQDATGGWYAKFPGGFHWRGIPIDSFGQPMLSTEPNTISFIRITWMGSGQGYVAEV